MKLQGIFCPLTTPFQFDGSLYKTKVFHNIEQLNKTALAGYAVCGTTGEGSLLTHAEKMEMLSWAAEACAPEKSLLAAGGAENVRETADLINRAAGLGYKAALIVTPRLGDSVSYFRAVADAARIPVIIENRPSATGVDLGADIVAQLSAHPNITGIVENSGNVERIVQLVAFVESGFQVLTGSAGALWPSLIAGASGAVPDFANAAPYACITIWEAFRTRESEAADDWQKRIARAAWLVTSKHGIPGLKAAMDRAGYYGGPPRLPLAPVNVDARREIGAAFDGIRS